MPVVVRNTFSVAFGDLDFRESFNPNSGSVEREIQCAWGDRHKLMREFLGYLDGFTIYLPHKYDPQDGGLRLYGLYARECSIGKVGISTTTHKPQKAKLTILYRTPDANEIDYGVAPVDSTSTIYITESLEPSSMFLTLSRNGLYIKRGADYKSLDDLNLEPPNMIIRTTDWVYTMHFMPSLPTFLDTLIGKVNSASVYSRRLKRTFPAETLLCGDPASSRQTTQWGNTAWEVAFRFTYMNNGTASVPCGWNHFPDTGALDANYNIPFVRLYDSVGNIARPYKLENFADAIL